MRRYDIYRLDDNTFTYLNSYPNRNNAESYLAKESQTSVFYVVNSNIDYEENGNWVFQNATLFLNGIPVKRFKHAITTEDVGRYTETLGRVYHTDGRITFLSDVDLTCQDMFDLIGGWGHVKVIKDLPERWAIVYRDVDNILLGKSKEKLPPHNLQASMKFNMVLYGNVIYMNENYL